VQETVSEVVLKRRREKENREIRHQWLAGRSPSRDEFFVVFRVAVLRARGGHLTSQSLCLRHVGGGRSILERGYHVGVIHPQIPFSEADVIREYLGRETRSGTCVDVGASIGEFCAPYALRGWQTVAIDADLPTCQVLKTRFEGFPRVTVLNRAVSDAVGEEVTFYASATHPGIHSLVPFHHSHQPASSMKTTTLDQELERLGIGEVELLKIDIEGADLLALKGFGLDKRRPEIIMVEFMDSRTVPHFGYRYRDIADYAASFGYETWVSAWKLPEEYSTIDDPVEYEWLWFDEFSKAPPAEFGNLLLVPLGNSERLLRAHQLAMRQARRRRRNATAVSALRAVPGARRAVRALRRGMSAAAVRRQ
jgi:FkbM family methyltransferase